MIPHSRPWISDGDQEALTETLRSGNLCGGEVRDRFESEIAAWLGKGVEGVATGSGTEAIALALCALGVKPGDDVLLPTYDCGSLLEALGICGASPVLYDAEADWTFSAEAVRRSMTPRARAVILPHLYGLRLNAAPFAALGLPLIEDWAQALDASQAKPLVGNAAILSFHPTKCLTTGEGGMVLTRDDQLANRMRQLQRRQVPFRHRRLGGVLSDLNASLGLSQLARYAEFLSRRSHQASAYRTALSGLASTLVATSPPNSMNFRFVVQRAGGLDAVREKFAEHQVAVRRGVDHLLHRHLGLPDHQFPESTRLYKETVSLPIYPSLSADELVRCTQAASVIFSEQL